MELPISVRLLTSIYILHWHIAFHHDCYLLFLEEDIEINLLYLDNTRECDNQVSIVRIHLPLHLHLHLCMRNETKYYSFAEIWKVIICCWQKELRIFGVRFQTANLANNGVVPEKLIDFNAVGLSIANLRFPRALIYEMIELKPAWPTFRRSFQALSTDTNRRNTPRSVWRPSHQTGFSNFTILFSLPFECIFMQARNTPKIKA